MLKPILLVEDDKRDIELALVALEKSGLANDVDVVRDGEAALDYLFRRGAWRDRVEGPPSLVILDVKLPKLDGHEVLAAIREEPSMKTLPVVMLTSSAEESDVLKSYDRGVNAYVVKPVAFSEFVRTISEVGIFWAVMNEPPPGSRRVSKRDAP